MTSTELQPLKAALASGNLTAIRAALPDRPLFLAVVFSLPASERDAILRGVLPVLETDEDRWDIIDAAIQHTSANPKDNALLPLMSLIPASLLGQTYQHASALPDETVRTTVLEAIGNRADALGVALAA